MNILREVAGELFAMFVSDAWMVIGILLVVSLTGLLTVSRAVPPLLAGTILLLGCIGVLVSSVVTYGRRHQRR
jgi:hypothetical protein